MATTACAPTHTLLRPYLETQPVLSAGDAADDVAIFQDEGLPPAILATDKQLGLLVFDFQGKRRFVDSSGHINNVDIRVLPGKRVLAGCSNRSSNSMQFFEYLPETYSLRPVPSSLPVTRIEEVYGFCLYQAAGRLSAFVVGKEGLLEGYALNWEPGDSLSAQRAFSYRFPGQCEGMVADDERGFLYVAEEDGGVWQLDLKTLGSVPVRVIPIASQPALKADLEGLALFRWEGKPYLFVSSQGNHSFSVFDADNGFHLVFSFQVAKARNIDKATETDGLDVSAGADGVLVVQDGRNTRKHLFRENQNFKMIRNKTFLPLIQSNK
jgi:3-phytase